MANVPALVPATPVNQVPTAVCLGCRTAMLAAGRCDCGDSRVVDIRKSRGRVLLRREVWGSDEQQGRLVRIGARTARAATLGLGAILFVALDYSSSQPDLGPPLVPCPVAVGLAAIVAGVAVGAAYSRDRKERRTRLRPHGVRAGPALASVGGSARPRLGIAEGETFRSPLGDEDCLAFEISLRAENARGAGADLVWREARTGGFTVRLDDGETVRIPPGSIRLSRAPDSARTSHAEACKRLLPELGNDDVGLPCVPSTAAFEQIVRPGARVAVVGPLESHEDGDAPRESLRAPSRMILVPVGTPVLALQDA